MRTFTKEQVAVGLAWFKTQPQDKYGGGPDGFPDTTCTQGGYEQVAGFIATALAEGRAAGLDEAAVYLDAVGLRAHAAVLRDAMTAIRAPKESK